MRFISNKILLLANLATTHTHTAFPNKKIKDAYNFIWSHLPEESSDNPSATFLIVQICDNFVPGDQNTNFYCRY